MTELLLRRPDDSGEFDSTVVRIGDEALYRTETLHSTGYRTANNPVIESIKQWLKGKLNISRRRRYHRGYYTPTNQVVEFDHK